eukprot:SM000018S03603  [mRNA]  locus=s18:188293:192214:- [translate_table: standard]
MARSPASPTGPADSLVPLTKPVPDGPEARLRPVDGLAAPPPQMQQQQLPQGGYPQSAPPSQQGDQYNSGIGSGPGNNAGVPKASIQSFGSDQLAEPGRPSGDGGRDGNQTPGPNSDVGGGAPPPQGGVGGAQKDAPSTGDTDGGNDRRGGVMGAVAAVPGALASAVGVTGAGYLDAEEHHIVEAQRRPSAPTDMPSRRGVASDGADKAWRQGRTSSAPQSSAATPSGGNRSPMAPAPGGPGLAEAGPPLPGQQREARPLPPGVANRYALSSGGVPVPVDPRDPRAPVVAPGAAAAGAPAATGGAPAPAGGNVPDEPTGSAAFDPMVVAKEVYQETKFFVLAGTLGAAPTVLSGLYWISGVSFTLQIILGVITGVAVMLLHFLMQGHRRRVRYRRAVRREQLATLKREDIETLLKMKNLPSWINFPEYDKARLSLWMLDAAADCSLTLLACGLFTWLQLKWLNVFIIKIWPFVNRAASELLMNTVQPILDQYKMGVIAKMKLKSVTLGNHGPRIDGVKILKAGPDEIVMELMVDWRQGRDQKAVLALDTLVGPDFTVKLKDIRLYGVLRLAFKPLTEHMPGIGAILVSLRESPLVEFDFDVLGGNLAGLPGLDGLIDNIIRTAVEDMLVYPNRIVVPIVPGDYKWLELRPVGRLDVTLIEARGLPKTDIIGSCDPYALIYVRQKQGKIKRSTTKHKNQTPTWNEGFFVEAEDLESQCLTIRMMDDERVERAEMIGIATLPLSQVQPDMPADMWLDLKSDPKDPESKVRGQVHINVVYKPYTDANPRKEEEVTVSKEEEAAGAKETKSGGAKRRGKQPDKNEEGGNVAVAGHEYE